MDASSELQCVGRLEITEPSKPLGFLCGSLPVPTDAAAGFRLFSSSSNARGGPRYQMLPAETDLNKLPALSNFHETVSPPDDESNEDVHRKSSSVDQSLSRKCEALAVSSLAEYGDEIDVVAPADIVKQIFRIPYTKAQLSVAVHRIGDTLILKAGPDHEEGEKIFRRQANHPKGSNSSIFLNFAMHSVRAEACDCPPNHDPSSEQQSGSTMLPGYFAHREGSYVSTSSGHAGTSQYFDQNSRQQPSQGSHGKFVVDTQQNKQKNRRANPTKRNVEIGEKSRCQVQESDKYKGVGDNGFLRVLFWQFHNFRMLLGSDLLIFSNEKYVAVSLHLWDVSRQVTPLTWLEAWLDNLMASVPELAICYHRNGVVQGYELLKTDDIFLLKGVSDDGTPAFHPQIVQQHGLSVLRFLQDNCKQDPGAYWLYKNAGEDVIQLFDLSIIPKNHAVDDRDACDNPLPSLLHKERRESLFSLGTLLYRVAHRLSLSKVPDKRARCAKFFKKCLDFLSEQDHLVVRAYAHEQFARLILRCYDELDLTSESFLLESEVMVTDLEEKSSDFSLSMSESAVKDGVASISATEKILSEDDVMLEPKTTSTIQIEIDSSPQKATTCESSEGGAVERAATSTGHDNLVTYPISEASSHVTRTVADPVSSKLAAIHHVSQAIKSLRWKRQLQNAEGDVIDYKNCKKSSIGLSLCACGDSDCIEVCDIREWLAKCKIDHKLWNLVLLLGESYLSLGEAYKEDGQLNQALKVVQVACLVYGSMPQHLKDACFISSMVSTLPGSMKYEDCCQKRNLLVDSTIGQDPPTFEDCYLNEIPSTYLFWVKAWMLVGDLYVDYSMKKGKEAFVEKERTIGSGLKMPNEVVREVKRLKKKLGQYQQNCSTCSLVNCSCQNDRASSGSNASSSSGDVATHYCRKHGRKSSTKNFQNSIHTNRHHDGTSLKLGNPRDNYLHNGGVKTSSTEISRSKESYAGTNIFKDKDTSGKESEGSREAITSESSVRDETKIKQGGIFKFLDGPKEGDVESNMLEAISCYNAAIQATNGFPKDSPEFLSVLKKKGWICNELGRLRLENKNLAGAEVAFLDAVTAFKDVSDHTNIILIYCNLGHGRRALAEELVTKMDEFKNYDILQHAYKQAMKNAKVEYLESLKYYGAAKDELASVRTRVDILLSTEVYTQYAHTYLRLGMLLARGDIPGDGCGSGYIEELHPGKISKEQSRHEMSAADAFREALSIYESLGDLRKQEAAYAHFQLACYHRDCCLEFCNLDQKQVKNTISENNYRQKAKWYASLAEKNWKKSIEFYGPKTHRVMYLNILLEQSTLSLSLSRLFHSNSMLEMALFHLLEGRHVADENEDGSCNQDSEIVGKFWNHLQTLLRSMLATSRSCSTSKAGLAVASSRVGDSEKLKEMYRISLRSANLIQLYAMHKIWVS